MRKAPRQLTRCGCGVAVCRSVTNSISSFRAPDEFTLGALIFKHKVC